MDRFRRLLLSGHNNHDKHGVVDMALWWGRTRVVALIGEIADRIGHRREIAGLDGQLNALRNDHSFQSGQMTSLNQLMGPEVLKRFAEEMQIPFTEAATALVATAFMEGVLAAISQEHALREDNEHLRAENRELRERPTTGLGVSATETIVQPVAASIEIPNDPRVRAVGAALDDYTRNVGENIEKVSDSVSITVVKAEPKK